MHVKSTNQKGPHTIHIYYPYTLHIYYPYTIQSIPQNSMLVFFVNLGFPTIQVEVVTVKALQWRLPGPGQARVIASPDGQMQLVASEKVQGGFMVILW